MARLQNPLNGLRIQKPIFNVKRPLFLKLPDATRDLIDECLGNIIFLVRKVEDIGVYQPPQGIDCIVLSDPGACDVLEKVCLLYTSPSPRDLWISRMPSSA